MENIVVGIAEGKVIKGSGELVTYALGSCVGICLYDKKNKVAGMAHILLPYRAEAVCRDNAYKFADSGIPMLINSMKVRGAERDRLVAKIAGGAEMFKGTGKQDKENKSMQVGQRNVEAAKKVLGELKIPVIAEDTGDHLGRTIYFSADTGKLSVNTVRWACKML